MIETVYVLYINEQYHKAYRTEGHAKAALANKRYLVHTGNKVGDYEWITPPHKIVPYDLRGTNHEQG